MNRGIGGHALSCLALAGLAPQLTVIPEPATLGILGLGSLGLLRRKK